MHTKMSDIVYLNVGYNPTGLCDCPDSQPSGACETGADNCTCEDS